MFKRIVEICDYSINSVQLQIPCLQGIWASPLCTLSFISCCSIFKDHLASSLNLSQEAHRRFTRDLDIIPYLGAFVKGFCKSFFNFFLSHSMFVEVWIGGIRLIQAVPFFQGSANHIRNFPLTRFFTRDLYIIPYLFEFVKRFFKKTWSIFETISLTLQLLCSRSQW